MQKWRLQKCSLVSNLEEKSTSLLQSCVRRVFLFASQFYKKNQIHSNGKLITVLLPQILILGFHYIYCILLELLWRGSNKNPELENVNLPIPRIDRKINNAGYFNLVNEHYQPKEQQQHMPAANMKVPQGIGSALDKSIDCQLQRYPLHSQQVSIATSLHHCHPSHLKIKITMPA